MMKSNEEPNPFDNAPDETKIKISTSMVAHSLEKVEKTIDGLSSASLKRVLKMVSHVHLADALLDRNFNTHLNETEQGLIDYIFALQETVFGHQALLQEVGTKEAEKSGIETIDMSVSLEEK